MYVGARMAALEEKRLMTERGGKFSFLVLVLKFSWTKETNFSIIHMNLSNTNPPLSLNLTHKNMRNKKWSRADICATSQRSIDFLLVNV